MFILEEALAQGCEFGDIEGSIPRTFHVSRILKVTGVFKDTVYVT